MSGNNFGVLFRLTTFGESHGEAIGGVIEGCPPNIAWDEAFIQSRMARRKAGATAGSTARKEDDIPHFLSGIYQGKTTGTPIAFLIYNRDQRPEDYSQAEEKIRPGHAGYSWEQRFGIFDPRGGGRASARETAARVAAGAVAELFLRQFHIEIGAYVSQLGPVALPQTEWYDPETVYASPVRCPDPKTEQAMIAYLSQVESQGDTVGGIVHCIIRNCPAGLGDPVFDKLQASLAHAMLSIPAAKGFQYGEGFQSVFMPGSAFNDTPVGENGKIGFATNHSGGITGGISTGQEIYFDVAFRPVSSVRKPQPTVTRSGEPASWLPGGRHDATVVPRAVPVVEAMAALVIADHILRWKAIQTH
ncbi:MAG: chorismate synthase [Bacteroidales bacterium]